MGQVTFQSTALVGTNRTGKLTPDADGYYELVVGAIDVYNSAGAYYDLEESRRAFAESSPFMRRVKDGVLYAELDHPRKEAKWSLRDYIGRLMEIRQDRHCAHIKEVRLDNNSVKDSSGRWMMAIIAKVKPAGHFGNVLKERLENSAENVCFSIRSLTDDVWVGATLIKKIKLVITFDCVLEPGIGIARKWFAPGLEALSDAVTITRDLLANLVSDRMHSGLGAEDDTTASLESLIKSIDWSQTQSPKIPTSMKW